MGENKYEIIIKVKELLREQMTNVTYTTWIKNLEIHSIKDNKVTLVVLSEMQKDIIETRLYKQILDTFNFVTSKNCELEIIEKKDIESLSKEKEVDVTGTKGYTESYLKPDCTFENFLVGGNNEFAHAVALAVSKEFVKEYNPLYIYGGVGLGKTHLMHAIGNRVIENNPKAKVLYVTSEKFINELINSIQDKNYRKELFRNKYRSIDVLLIDDIQFLIDKKMGQEEFFNTFNALHDAGKRIVISSDRPPKELENLEDRLKGRFSMGVMADVSKPDYETRLAILKKEVEEEKLIIDDYILAVIAKKIDSNIRELKGALHKVKVYSNVLHSHITIEIAEKAIHDMIMQDEKIITADYIQETVAQYFNVEKRDLISSKRSNDIVFPRQIAMYLCRTVAQMGLEPIGKAFGKKDHTTVMHAVNKIEKEMQENFNIKLIVGSLKNKLLDKN